MTETKCPLCGKSLINGSCEECGFYDDNVKLENESSAFYTEEISTPKKADKLYGFSFIAYFKSLLRKKEKSSSLNISYNKIAYYIIAVFIPILGVLYALSLIIENTPKSKVLGYRLLAISGPLLLFSLFIFYFRA